MTPPILLWLPIILGGLFALGCLIGAFYFLSRKRLIDDLPTSKTQGVFIGLTELKGTAESDAPLTSFLGEIQCVQYNWKIEEHWSRTVIETYRNSQGHMQTRTRTESGWTNIASDKKAIPFYLKDDAGIIRILPEGATIHSKTVFDQTCSPFDRLYFGKGPAQEIANSTHLRRFRETALLLHTSLYVVGPARERPDIVAAEIAKNKRDPIFLISIRSEKQVSRSYAGWFWFWLIFGLILSLVGVLVKYLIEPSGQTMFWQPYIIALAGFLIVSGLGTLWTMYNSIINLKNRVSQAWSQVDIQLKRRNDLLSNLVKVVDGYQIYEREVQTSITELRAQLSNTPQDKPDINIKSLIPALQIIVERYPDLKANESFLNLQKILTETEQRIALARDYFNEIATFYNTRREIIPDRFIAALMKLRPRELMSTSDLERAAIKVNLVT